MSKRIEMLDKKYILKELEGVRLKNIEDYKEDDQLDQFDFGYLAAILDIIARIQSMKPIKIVCPLCSNTEVEKEQEQICDPPEQNVIATVAEWKNKMLKDFMGRVE